MTESDLLEHVLDRLTRANGGAETFGADEVRQWPDGAFANLVSSGVLRPAQPTGVVVCDGCENNCFKPVTVRPAETGRPAIAFVACDEPEDMGRIPVELNRLEQWQLTSETLAGAVARLLGFPKPPQNEGTRKLWVLGLLEGGESKGAVTLSIENVIALTLARHSVRLASVLTLDRRGLKANKSALLRLLDGDAREPASGVGSRTWRKQKAKAAADARHAKPGGSRDKQQQIREIWATGKYSSRDRCAEEECASLDMSYSAARKALRNTPKP